jgi:hypothetical protein
MKTGLRFRLVSTIMALGAASAAPAAMVWNESANGDLSNDGLSPTSVIMTEGLNTIFGTTGAVNGVVDRDYFTFVVPIGMTLSSLTVVESTSISGSVSFLMIQAGPQLTVTPSGGGIESSLGHMHYGPDKLGFDLLPDLIFGYTGPLPSGAYSLWIQETGGTVGYGLEFGLTATPVPLPGAAIFLLTGMLGLGALRRREKGG